MGRGQAGSQFITGTISGNINDSRAITEGRIYNKKGFCNFH